MLEVVTRWNIIHAYYIPGVSHSEFPIHTPSPKSVHVPWFTRRHYNIACYDLPYYNIPYDDIPYHNIPCHNMVYCNMVCYHILCYNMVDYRIAYYNMVYCNMACYIVWCIAMSCYKMVYPDICYTGSRYRPSFADPDRPGHQASLPACGHVSATTIFTSW